MALTFLVQLLYVKSKKIFRLLSPEGNETLEELGRIFKFELVIGFNGRIWIKAKDSRNTIIVANAIIKSQLPKTEFELLLRKLKQL